MTKQQLSIWTLAATCVLTAGAVNAQTAQTPTSPRNEAQPHNSRSATPGSSHATPNQSTRPAQAGGADNSETMGVLVLVPAVQASDDKFANGCWVRFYDDKNYKGASLTLVGPVDMPKMNVPGAVWKDWDSAVVGSKARVTTYDNENFRDRTAGLNPGQRYPDLRDKKLGWFEEMHSARVACSN